MIQLESLEKSDRLQKLRMRNVLLGLSAYCMFILFWVYIYFVDGWLTSLSVALFALGLGVATQLTFLLLILKGFNLRFHDPGMTFLQITTSMTVNIPLLYYIEAEMRGIVLFAYLYPFLFSVLRLGYRQCFLLAAFAVVGYWGVLGLLQVHHPERVVPYVELLRTFVFSCTMFWVGFFSAYLSKIRRRLRAKNAEIKAMAESMRNLADSDDLTGLFNRRRFYECLKQESARSKRSLRGFCIGIIDLDHFKKINDTYGHLKGDEVLREFAKLISEKIRINDVASRYGGEEFVILFVDTRLDEAYLALNRLLICFRQLSFEAGANLPGKFSCTFSAGLAFNEPHHDPTLTLELADRALYKAKDRGRNCIVDESRPRKPLVDQCSYGKPDGNSLLQKV